MGQNYKNEKVSINQIHNDKKEMSLCQHSKKCGVCQACTDLTLGDIKFLLYAQSEVQKSGKFNFEGCKISINNRMNIDYIRSWLTDYKDKEVCDLLEYGFPIGLQHEASTILNQSEGKDIWKIKNHKGAEEFPDEMNKYFQKETLNKAVLGPFKKNPFSSGIQISPLNFYLKKILLREELYWISVFPKDLQLMILLAKKNI